MDTILEAEGRRWPEETYTPGHTAPATEFMAARTLASHASFVHRWLRPGMRVLDCGCGPGTITLGLADAVFPGRVTGLDCSSSQAQSARRLAEGLELVNVSFLCGSAYELPMADGTFDLVFAHALFEHLGRPGQALAEMHRVLRPGGIIALASPDWDAFRWNPAGPEVRVAMDAYRAMQERNGGNTRAGAFLPDWLKAAGFAVIDDGMEYETYHPTARIGEYLGFQLEKAGHLEEGLALRKWSCRSGSRFDQAWGYAVAVRP